MADKKAITIGGHDYIPRATSLLSTAFESDPTLTYILNSSMKTLHQRRHIFSVLLTAAALNGGRIDEIDTWRSCGVLIPPGCRVDNPWTVLRAGCLGMAWMVGGVGCRRMLELSSATAAMKKKYLTDARYYYVFFLGTKGDARGKGLCSAIVRRYQALAAEAGLPIWLEASTEGSRRLYEKLGFEVCGEVVLGEGRADADGTVLEGGPGCKIWGMVWRRKWYVGFRKDT